MNRLSSRRRQLAAFGLVSLVTFSASQALAAGGFSSATASGNDGNVPANAIDGSLSTRWSSDGRGQWIQGDLGAVKSLSALDIAWYNGNVRASNFTIGVSSDGSTFTTVFSGTSSGKTASAERYTFPAKSARYVRVTVNGNTVNTWASISELAAASSTEPVPTPTPTPTPETGKDVFGVTMIYPTKAGGETWFLKDNALQDTRFDPQDTITRNADGSWKNKSSQVRMHAKTTTGYDSKLIPTYDPDVLASRGYMQAANDWKNVEMTGFIKVNAASDMSDNFAWYARGGRHTDSLACEGTSYKGSLHYDGRARWQKESWHVSYDQTSYQTATSSLKGRWVGFKSIMKNTTYNGKAAVKLELWLNDNADKVTWKKIYDTTDYGQIGGDLDHCGGSVAAAPLTWGGPLATFRWDSASDVDFKWLSVREIAE
ncbi:discoidin domain-containing protein [Archangium violaceum]|uniref:discoidin domain-containing protein n=1 Tax=Archangium violaceum TaxID=83451 RepID=UPI001950B77F|nr:discoidin domain-containing protein [Archangium violaceum]QRN96399.1 discoidin domain-containing protein [Archangium violaceum]